MSVKTPKCLHPQFITGRTSGKPVMVPCGQCFYCKRKLSRRWVGKAMLETRFPVYMDETHLDRIHKFDLTYKDTPMTIPRPHNLGEVIVDGKVKYFAGPWANNKFPRQRIETREGKPYYVGGDLCVWDDPAFIRIEHRQYLASRLGWSTEQIENWLNGEYEPQQTTSVRDIQRFIDRLRKWHSRNRPSEPKLRYLCATEYGSVTQRPHAHLIVWGLHPDDSTIVHDLWEGYQRGAATNGHVHPDRRECVLNRASIVTGGAESYSVKDVPKSRHLTHGNPAIYEQETPRVFGSKEPPIGDGAYPHWLENHIQAGLHRAATKITARGGECEIQLCMVLRQLYNTVSVELPPDSKGRPRSETFPTTQRWRDLCRQHLQIPDDIWTESSRRMELDNAKQTDIIKNDPEVRELHKQHIDELRERRDEIHRKTAERTEAKRAKLIAAGKLQPTG